VGVETRLHAGRSGVRITIGARDLSSPNRPPGFETHPAFIQWVPRFFLGVTRPGRDVDHSPPSSAEFKDRWRCASALLACLYGVDRDNCIRPFSFRSNAVVSSVCVYHVLECSVSRNVSTTTFMYLVLGIDCSCFCTLR
jgi:hypothetical protein